MIITAVMIIVKHAEEGMKQSSDIKKRYSRIAVAATATASGSCAVSFFFYEGGAVKRSHHTRHRLALFI